MTMYVYSTDGDPRGFLFSNFIHDMSGEPLGRIIGSRVHRLDGAYVGEWFHNMIVAKPSGRARSMPPVAKPIARPAPPPTYIRRKVAEYGMYPDAFHQLLAHAAHETEAAD